MTSKEKLWFLYSALNQYLDFCKHETNPLRNEDLYNKYKAIEKDLEILYLFKKYYCYGEMIGTAPSFHARLGFVFDDKLTSKEDFNKIKEWFENEN